MNPTERSVIYVFNDGGKFRSQNAKEAGAPLLLSTCPIGQHSFVPESTANKKRCSACSRLDLAPVAKCSKCIYSLCSPCARANGILDTSEHPREPHRSNTEEKIEEELIRPDFQPEKHVKGLFPTEQTLQFALMSSGGSRDLPQRLSIFVNSKMGEKENQVEHVTAREDLDLAWVVLRSPDALQKFRLKCAGDQAVDLLDGWRAKWKCYVSPKTRRVYRVDGIPLEVLAAPTFCSRFRKILEEQLKMLPSDIDLVTEGEGNILIIFSHGEYDVSFTRSVFLADGRELAIVPTDAAV